LSNAPLHRSRLLNRPDGGVRRSEWLWLLALIVASLLAARSLPSKQEASYDPDRLPEPPANTGWFIAGAKHIPRVDITIEPEFVRTLNAGRPRFDGCSRRVRLKSVPVESVHVEGRRQAGRFTLRYRGFCDDHWRHKQKSLKLKGVKGSAIAGYRTLNLNTLNSDTYLFENWATLLMHRSGGITSRTGLTRVFINGKDDGLHPVIENLDIDLINQHRLPKGALYRERNHLVWGEKPHDSATLQVLWKKNALGNTGWEDLRTLNAAIYDSLSPGKETWRNFFDIPHYVNYNAIATLTGTQHFDTHNIPIYRPRTSERFLPVAYDFGFNLQGQHHGVFSALQTPYLALNLPGQLMWADAHIRERIHRRIAYLLERFPDMEDWYDELLSTLKPELQKDIQQQLWRADPEPQYATWQGYVAANKTRPALRDRLAFLRMSYLNPLARLTPQWQSKKKSQLAIEGAGIYRITVRPGAPCEGGELRLRAHHGPWHVAAQCKNGTVTVRPFTAERNDMRSPQRGSRVVTRRASIGAILVDIEKSGGLPTPTLDIVSLATQRPVPTQEDWMFNIRKTGDGKAEIGITSLPFVQDLENEEGWSIVNLNRASVYQPLHTFHYNDTDGGRLVIKDRVQREGPNEHLRHGPLLCWNTQGRKYCYEFDQNYAPAGSERAPLAAQARHPWQLRFLDLAAFANCSEFKFTAERWYIPGPARSPAKCAVGFSPGAELYFAPNAFMEVMGAFIFPEQGKRVMFKPHDKEWGGVILHGNRPNCRVQGTLFTGANEFLDSGLLRTGALTVVQPADCLIRENIFLDNLGDDALNVEGGNARVRSNFFYGNRDAMDFDGGRIEASGNLVFASKDDGIDLGEGVKAVLNRNIVIASGDKGISVGEGAEALVAETLLYKNNLGVGIKERSAAQFHKALLRDNAIGIAIYRTPEARLGDRGGRVKGSASFQDNTLAAKVDGSKRSGRELGLSVTPYAPTAQALIIEAVTANCGVCSQYIWMRDPFNPRGPMKIVRPLELLTNPKKYE
jgi:hypothetical protein